nr:divergent polysaccharide deacetylase family protein [Desulfobacteraceae bacterium]
PISLGAAFYIVFLRTPGPWTRIPPSLANLMKRERPTSPPAPAPSSALPAAPKPVLHRKHKSFPVPKPAPLPAVLRSPAKRRAAAPPRVAIVVDDMGLSRVRGEQMLAQDLDLTFSFLPHAPHTEALIRAAKRRGRDILMHLPMEPEDAKRWDPGPGALFLSMSKAALRQEVERDLALVPGALGVNNHMGSKLTADREAMRTVLALFPPRGLFFLDSLTTPASVGFQVAMELGVPARRRDVFLDNVQEPAAIARQIDQLIQKARQHGTAVAICHPYPATIAALAANRQRLRREVEVVGLHRLMNQ